MGDVRWLVAAVVLGSSAQAAPRMALVAVGDCREPDLLRDQQLFAEQLAERVGGQLLTQSQFQARVGPPPSHSLEEVRRQVATAENLFYNDRVAESLGELDKVLAELERLPPGPERWQTFAAAQLVRGLALSTARKRDASDDAFRAVLRLDGKHVMSADAFSPLFRQRFEKLRAEVARTPRVKLSVQSQPAGGTVYLDGFAVGHTPLVTEVVPGSYQVLVGRPDAFSFPHPVTVREDTALRVDLGFEQSIPPSRAACLQQPRDGKDAPLGNALKLALLLEVDQLVVLRLERPAAGPGWLSAAVLNAQTAQRTREGGVQLHAGGASDDLPELARFVVTGETGKRVVVVGTPGATDLGATAATAPHVQADAPSGRTWKTPAGIALTAAGVAGIGVGVLFHLKANDSASKFNQAYAGGAAPPQSQVATVDGYRSDANSQRTLSYVGVGVGTAALGAGLWLWLTDGKPPVTASVTPDGTLLVAGRF